MLAYLRLLVNPQDTCRFLRVVNEPARGIGKVSLDQLQAYADRTRDRACSTAAGQVAKIPTIKGKAATGLRDFHRLIDRAAGAARAAAGRGRSARCSTRPATGRCSASRATTRTPTGWRTSRNSSPRPSSSTTRTPSRTIADFLEHITLARDVDGWDEQQDCVSVMTLHAAKGLEFPVVYILAVEQGILPHERSLGKRRGRRGGAAAVLRRHDAGDEGAVPVPRPAARVPRADAATPCRACSSSELPARRGARSTCRCRGTSPAAPPTSGAARSGRRRRAWADTGTRPLLPPKPAPTDADDPGRAGRRAGGRACWCSTTSTGIGTVTDVSGYGALRKVKIRFAAAGEKTFIADKVKLKVVTKQ